MPETVANFDGSTKSIRVIVRTAKLGAQKFAVDTPEKSIILGLFSLMRGPRNAGGWPFSGVFQPHQQFAVDAWPLAGNGELPTENG
jgi:hypothetical protein